MTSRFCASLLTVAIAAGLLLTATAAPAAVAVAHDPNHILVRFDTGTSVLAKTSVHDALGATVVNTIAAGDIEVVRVPDGTDATSLRLAYLNNPLVRYADLNKQVRLLSVPNDVSFSDLWGLHNTGQSVKASLVTPRVVDADIDAPEGWDAAFGPGQFPTAGGTRVGILDTGIDRSHVELFDKVKACAQAISAIGVVTAGACSDDNLHGTHVAGTVAATANNNVGVAGVAPNSELAIFKGLNGAGLGFLADIVAGIYWLHQQGGARIISMSLGSASSASTEAQAVKDADAAGVLVIAAAGNDGDDTKNYPAFYPEAMSVAATNQADKISTFSTCNSDVEIAAPGEDIWSTFPGNSYGVISGTSMATPHVSGVASLIMWAKGLNSIQTRNQMKSTAVTITGGGNGRSLCNGYKRVNLAAALGAVAPPPPPPSPGAIAGKVTEFKTGTALSGANVSCGTAGAATTDTSGNYTISNVTPGSYTCTASKTGYINKNANVTVTSGATTTLNFALRK
ncbi:MAG: S8 family serine peptidase [Actinomycetota bacterium]